MNDFGNWKKGNMNSVVSSQSIKGSKYNQDCHEGELNAYGGYMVCETIATEEIRNLLLSAPDLLEACKNMYQRLRLNQGAGFQFPPPVVELMEELQAAIAKAEGTEKP